MFTLGPALRGESAPPPPPTTGEIIGRFNGTNGQTSGVANDGTMGGTFTFANGAAVSTDALENGLGVPYQAPPTLKFPGVASGTPQANCPSAAIAGGVLVDAFSNFNLDFRFKFGAFLESRPTILVRIFSRYNFIDLENYSTMNLVLLTDNVGSGEFVTTTLSSPDYGLGGGTGSTPPDFDYQEFSHFRLSVDSSRNVRLFIDGAQVGTTGSLFNALSNKANPRLVITIAEPGYDTSPVYIDSLRLALGEATTANFTPPSPAI